MRGSQKWLPGVISSFADLHTCRHIAPCRLGAAAGSRVAAGGGSPLDAGTRVVVIGFQCGYHLMTMHYNLALVTMQQLIYGQPTSFSQALADAGATADGPLPAATLALANQPLTLLGRLPELMPLRLLAHRPARTMQRPLLQLAVSHHLLISGTARAPSSCMNSGNPSASGHDSTCMSSRLPIVNTANVQGADQAAQQLSLLAQLQRLRPLLNPQHAGGDAVSVPAQQLRALQGAVGTAVATGSHGGTASALQLAPLQRLAWALDAISHDAAVPEAHTLAGQLPETLHELWFRWHDAQWPLGPHTSTLRPGAAARSTVLAELASAAGSTTHDADVSTWPARVLQLRMAARHAVRCW